MIVEASLPPNDLAAVSGLARWAEEAGFDGVSASEVTSNPFVTLAIAAEHTLRVRLTTDIALAFVRSPITMSYLALDLQRFSGGRLCLGLGSQTKWQIERRFGMPWSAPAAHMRDYIGAMRAAWRSWEGELPFEYQGEVYQLDVMTPNHRPPLPDSVAFPKVMIAAVGPRMSHVAGQVADGIHIHPFGTLAFVNEFVLPRVREGAQQAGRSLDGFEVSGGGLIVTAPTPQSLNDAIAEARTAIAYYGHFPEYQQVWAMEGWEKLGETLQAYAARGDWAAMPGLIDDEVLHRFAAVGTYAEIGERVLERFGGYATRVRLPSPARGCETELVPSVRLLQQASLA